AGGGVCQKACAPALRLPEEFYRKLYVARIASGPADPAKLSGPDCRARGRELRPIEAVEKLRAELHFSALINLKILEQRKIPVIDARSNHYVAAGSSPAKAIGRPECVSVEKAIDAAVGCIVRLADQVRTAAPVAHIGRVAGLRDRERRSGPRRVDGIKLPATE